MPSTVHSCGDRVIFEAVVRVGHGCAYPVVLVSFVSGGRV